MKSMEPRDCQSQLLKYMATGSAKLPPLSVFRRFKLELRRRLPYKTIQWIQSMIDRFLLGFAEPMKQDRKNSEQVMVSNNSHLQPGDLVRVRSAEEIGAMLNRWQKYKGCGFMDDMWQYCDSVQTVLKPVERFVDERDYQVKKVKGIVLLEGNTCQGTPIFGRCDRNCYYFWREEWLEKLA